MSVAMLRLQSILALAGAVALGACGAAAPAPRAAAASPPAPPTACTDYRLLYAIPFDCGDAELTRWPEAEIEGLVARLRARRGLTRVRLSGVQSLITEGDLPPELAEQRAASVARALVEHGIDADMIDIQNGGLTADCQETPETCSDDGPDPPRQSRRVFVDVLICGAEAA